MRPALATALAVVPLVASASTTMVAALPVVEQPAATLLALVLAFALGGVHLFGQRLRWLDMVPRSGLLSAAGGASVAYVFVHLLPEVERARQAVEDTEHAVVAFSERHVYVVALAGFVAFYGLERLARCRGWGPQRDEGPVRGVFWVHVGSFAVYNGLVGYLLVHREEAGTVGLLAFFVAMGLHFLVNDFGLHDRHRAAYRQIGRWVLAAAVVGGAAVGALVELGPGVVWILFAFLAGAIVLNTIKEELPAERESRFWAFAGGAAGYSAVLLFA